MKSYYKTFSESQLNEKIKEEMEKYKDEVYEKVTWDVFKQALAVCFAALELMGWRKKRLNDFYDKVDAVCRLMVYGVMGQEVTTKDVIKRLSDEYGIDFEKSIHDVIK